jgi:hypothetical protein
MVNWFEKEKKKDDLEIMSSKNKIISEIKNLKKDEFFKKEEPKKLNIWQKIKVMIWGN